MPHCRGMPRWEGESGWVGGGGGGRPPPPPPPRAGGLIAAGGGGEGKGGFQRGDLERGLHLKCKGNTQ